MASFSFMPAPWTAFKKASVPILPSTMRLPESLAASLIRHGPGCLLRGRLLHRDRPRSFGRGRGALRGGRGRARAARAARPRGAARAWRPRRAT